MRLARTMLYLGATALCAEPNFTGTWKLNLEKSKLPEQWTGMKMERKIEHKGVEMKVDTFASGPQGDVTLNARYTTDGKQNINPYQGHSATSTLQWESETLAIQTTIVRETDDIKLDDRWTLSADQKTITVERKQKGPGEHDYHLVLVFDKS